PEMLRESVGLAPDVPHSAARFVQRATAGLHVRERTAQIQDALADGVEPLVLELEALDGPLDLIAQPVQSSVELLIRLRDLVVPHAHLSRPRKQIAVERLQVGDTGLERAQTL